MTKSLVTRIALSFLAYKVRSAWGDAGADLLLQGARYIFPDQKLGSLDDILNAKDTSQDLEKAFDQADNCFRESTPYYLASINSSGGIPFRGITLIKDKAKDISEDAEAEFLVIVLRNELTATIGTILTPDEIEQCVGSYLSCLEKSIYKHFPSERAIINLLYENADLFQRKTEQLQKSIDEIPSKVINLLQALEAVYKGTGNRRRVKLLPPKKCDPLIGRDQEVERICQQILQENESIMVLYGPSGVGVSSIAREVLGKLDGTNPPLDEYQQENIFPIWFKVPVTAHSSKRVCGKFQDWLSDVLGAESQSDASCWEELQKGFNVLVVDGLRREIAADILEYLNNIQFPNVRIIVTCPEELPWENYHLHPSKIRIRGINTADIPAIFRLHGYDQPLSDVELKEIADQTDGNIQRLIRIADDRIKGFSHKKSLERDAETEREFIRKLSERARFMLMIIALYEEFVFEKVLFSIFERTYPEEGYHTLDQLTQKLIVSPDPSNSRYTIGENLRRIIKEMEKPGEYDSLREQWTNFYCDLREGKRKSNFNDEIGWTIFTDYQPEDDQGVSYADEATNILDVIRYCLSDARISTHAEKAAKLLDNFRATIFASGRWEDRLTYCEQVVEYAKTTKNFALLGKFYRLLAWIHCFRDEYEDGRDLAMKAIRVAKVGLQAPNLDEKDRYTHQQTLYKAYNTLGQIALRDARRSTWARRQLRKAIEDASADQPSESNVGESFSLANAVDQFQEAEIKFAQALLHLDEFPPEALIMKYHMAEVKYYDRDPVTTTDTIQESFYTFEQLNRVLPLFLNVLKKAQEPFPEYEVTRPHLRLIANTKLYLGKILRRKGTLALVLEKPNADQYLTESMQYLQDAFLIADMHNDRVLKAKIKFAQCQWYESRAGSTQDKNESASYLSLAKRLALESIQEFQVTRMRLEGDDALAFYERRLSSNDYSL